MNWTKKKAILPESTYEFLPNGYWVAQSAAQPRCTERIQHSSWVPNVVRMCIRLLGHFYSNYHQVSHAHLQTPLRGLLST